MIIRTLRKTLPNITVDSPDDYTNIEKYTTEHNWRRLYEHRDRSLLTTSEEWRVTRTRKNLNLAELITNDRRLDEHVKDKQKTTGLGDWKDIINMINDK